MKVKIENPSFTVPSGQISTTYFIQETDPDAHLAVVLPGAGYTCKQPLLY